MTWATAWAAVERHGGPLPDDAQRVGPTVQVGFDETVMSPARRHRRRRFITAAVDVTTGQILDVFEGSKANDLKAWLTSQPEWWRTGIEVASVDPHEGYRSAIVGSGLLDDAVIVVDPFHIVRVRHEAPCIRRRVRDPPLRTVAAVR